MPEAFSPLAALLSAQIRPGQVRWLGLRPVRRGAMVIVEAARLVADEGLVGDRWKGRPGGARQVTLVAEEDLTAIAGFLRLPSIAPERLRRNIVVRGINLMALKGRRFRVGGAMLEMSGEAHPCSRMEEEFGEGGYNAVRGRGGITARVLEAGEVRLGDRVERWDERD